MRRFDTYSTLPTLAMTCCLIFVQLRDSVQAEELLTDIVLVIDKSGSMNKVDLDDGSSILYEELKAELGKFVDERLPRNANVTLIAFGEDAEVVRRINFDSEQGRRTLASDLEQLRASDQHTAIAKALYLAQAEIARLKEASPDHHRLLVLITDGKNNAPQGVSTTFDDILTQQRELKLNRGEDFYMWYAHLGTAQPELEQQIKDTFGGRPVPMTSAKFGSLAFSRRVLRLPRQMPGNWRQAFPTETDRQRKELLIGHGINCEGEHVKFGPITVPGLPPNAELEIEPQGFPLRDGRQDFVFNVKGTNVPPGDYSGRVEINIHEPNGLIMPSPQYFYLDFSVGQPVIALSPSDRLDLGVATLRKPATSRLVLTPHVDAEILKPNLEIDISFQDLPSGVEVEARAGRAKMLVNASAPRGRLKVSGGEMIVVEITSRVHDAAVELGAFTGQLVVRADNPFVDIRPARLPVKLEARSQAIALQRHQFAASFEDQHGFEFEVPLDTSELPPGKSLQAFVDEPRSPDAPPLTVTPPRFTLTSETPAVVKMRAVMRNPRPGKWTYEVPLRLSSELCSFTPSSIRLTLNVVRPQVRSRLMTDVTSLYRGDVGKAIVTLMPNQAAVGKVIVIECKPSHQMPDGITITAPQRVTLEDNTEFEVTIQAEEQVLASVERLEAALSFKGGEDLLVQPATLPIPIKIRPHDIVISQTSFDLGEQLLDRSDDRYRFELLLPIDTQQSMPETKLNIFPPKGEARRRVRVEGGWVIVKPGEKQIAVGLEVIAPAPGASRIPLDFASHGASVHPKQVEAVILFKRKPWPLWLVLSSLIFTLVSAVAGGRVFWLLRQPDSFGRLVFRSQPAGEKLKSATLGQAVAQRSLFRGLLLPRNRVVVGTSSTADIRLQGDGEEGILFHLVTDGFGQDATVSLHNLGTIDVQVNEHKSQRAALHHEAKIEVGPYVIEYLSGTRATRRQSHSGAN